MQDSEVVRLGRAPIARPVSCDMVVANNIAYITFIPAIHPKPLSYADESQAALTALSGSLEAAGMS